MTTVQKTILGVVLVVAVIIGALLVSGKRAQSPGAGLGTLPALTPTSPASVGRQPQKTPTITETEQVQIKGNAFAPALISVKQGALVTWTNYDLRPHSVVGSGFNSGALSEAAVWSHQFTKRGRYEYRCSIHPGIKGVVEVR